MSTQRRVSFSYIRIFFLEIHFQGFHCLVNESDIFKLFLTLEYYNIIHNKFMLTFIGLYFAFIFIERFLEKININMIFFNII